MRSLFVSLTSVSRASETTRWLRFDTLFRRDVIDLLHSPFYSSLLLLSSSYIIIIIIITVQIYIKDIVFLSLIYSCYIIRWQIKGRMSSFCLSSSSSPSIIRWWVQLTGDNDRHKPSHKRVSMFSRYWRHSNKDNNNCNRDYCRYLNSDVNRFVKFLRRDKLPSRWVLFHLLFDCNPSYCGIYWVAI